MVTHDGWVAADAPAEPGPHRAVARLVVIPLPKLPLSFKIKFNITYIYTGLLGAKDPTRQVLRNRLRFVDPRVAEVPFWNEALAREDTWRSL